MKLSFTTTITTLLVLCALVMTALVVKREFFASIEIPEPLYELDEESWRLASEQGVIVGEDSVPVRIVVFHDYECSVCRKTTPILNIVSRKFSGKIAIVYRHLPLPRHPLAHSAAIASECANKQDSFTSYHAALYEKQGSLKNDDWGLIAQEIGIAEINTFLDCMGDKDVREKVDGDKRLAESLGITSVPTFIVNKKLFEGLLSVAELDVIVQDLLQNELLAKLFYSTGSEGTLKHKSGSIYVNCVDDGYRFCTVHESVSGLPPMRPHWGQFCRESVQIFHTAARASVVQGA